MHLRRFPASDALVRTSALALVLTLFAACSGEGPGSTPTNPTPGVPEEIAWDPAGLADISRFVDSTNTSAFVLMFRGDRVLEGYPTPTLDNLSEAEVTSYQLLLRPPTEDNFPVFDVTEIQFGVLGLLASMAVERNLLDLESSVSTLIGDGWSGADVAAERAITVRHVLSMTTGLDLGLNRVAAPGEAWLWNPTAFQRMHDILPAATGLSMDVLLRRWLSEPMNLRVAEWLPGPGGRTGLSTSARDLGDLGLLIAEGGVFDGDRVVASRAISRLRAPTQQLNPAWGMGWWINNQTDHITKNGVEKMGAFVPNAPSDMIFAFGSHDQVVGVLRSQDVIVVRLGAWVLGTDAERPMERLWELITETAPR